MYITIEPGLFSTTVPDRGMIVASKLLGKNTFNERLDALPIAYLVTVTVIQWSPTGHLRSGCASSGTAVKIARAANISAAPDHPLPRITPVSAAVLAARPTRGSPSPLVQAVVRARHSPGCETSARAYRPKFIHDNAVHRVVTCVIGGSSEYLADPTFYLELVVC